MPLWDLAVRTRYPKDGDVTKGPIKLLDIDSSTGWWPQHHVEKWSHKNRASQGV